MTEYAELGETEAGYTELLEGRLLMSPNHSPPACSWTDYSDQRAQPTQGLMAAYAPDDLPGRGHREPYAAPRSPTNTRDRETIVAY